MSALLVRSFRMLWLPAMVLAVLTSPLGDEPQGQYFAKKRYVPAPLPKFDEMKEKLPSPIYDEDPLLRQDVLESVGAGFQELQRAPAAEAVSSRSSSTPPTIRTSSSGTRVS